MAVVMKILKINSQNRRDFYWDGECEHCGAIEKDKSGYDDDNYHINVIPKMECKICGKKGSENYEPLNTRYASYEVI